jgi:FixJ family two-component response regulator
MIGFELRRTLITGGVRIPTIFITAYDDEATHQCAKHAGAVSYLTKPIDGQVLLDAIHRAVREPRQT